MSETIDRTIAFCATLDCIDVICGEIASGGTLTEFCRENGFGFKLINRRIQSNDDDARRYADALIVRETHLKEEIIAEIAGYLRCDLTQAFDENGNMLRLADMPRGVKSMIAGYEFEEIFETSGSGKSRERIHVGNMHKIKLHDKPRSIEMLMKNLKMLVDRHEVTASMSLADLLKPDPPKPEDAK